MHNNKLLIESPTKLTMAHLSPLVDRIDAPGKCRSSHAAIVLTRGHDEHI